MKTILTSKDGQVCDRCAVCGTVVADRMEPQCPRCGGDPDLARNLLAQEIELCVHGEEDDIHEVADRAWACGYKAEAYLIHGYANLVTVDAAARDAAAVAAAALARGQQQILMLGGVNGLVDSRDRVRMHGAGMPDE